MDEFLDLQKLANELDSQDKIIESISETLKHVLENNPASFVNFLYRFDLAEELIAPFLAPPVNYQEIAKLVWQRQVKKMNNWSNNQ